MKLAFTLAWRNLIGAGLRTWLNVIVLSFTFVIIIWLKGILSGWDQQAKNDMKDWEIAGGQWWHDAYDPFDPLSLESSHAVVPLDSIFTHQSNAVVPALMVQASIFPNGRMQQAILKGIPPHQTLFNLPSALLDTTVNGIPVVIGQTMAKNMDLSVGDLFTLRWRDRFGSFDAAEAEVVGVFYTNVPAVDQGLVYLDLAQLQRMTMFHNEATILSFREGFFPENQAVGWKPKTVKELTKQVDEMIKTKSAGQSVMYLVLLFLAMLAIFDTQVLSIFRRQREIGTYIALGYTRPQVVGLFTLEGSMHAVLAAIAGAFYGIPFLWWQAKVGWTLPMDSSEFGMAMAPTLYPVYSIGLIASTVLLVLLTTTVVSYFPSRKIAKMNPTEALRGKLQ